MRVADEARDDLRATAESITVDAERLQAIERKKLAMKPDQPTETRRLAAQAEKLAEEIADKARAEKALADLLADRHSADA
jgi:hypothetical protein